MKVEKPGRVVRTYTQKINGKPAEIFPLLCPVREAEWIDGWDPEVVYSNSGVAEQDCIFITYIGGVKTVWIINRYEPENNFVEMIRTTGDKLVVKLSIKLTAFASGTDVQITYSYNAISDEGKKQLDVFTEEYFEEFMKEWEENMNYFLLNNDVKKRS